MLRETKTSIDLFSTENKDIYHFFESAKRGGFSVINTRHLKANRPDHPSYKKNDEEEPSWILYLDSNNLYGRGNIFSLYRKALSYSFSPAS